MSTTPQALRQLPGAHLGTNIIKLGAGDAELARAQENGLDILMNVQETK